MGITSLTPREKLLAVLVRCKTTEHPIINSFEMICHSPLLVVKLLNAMSEWVGLIVAANCKQLPVGVQ